MASIAGGKIDGIAPKANLYLFKIQGHWNKNKQPPEKPEPDILAKIQPMPLMPVFDRLRMHVAKRLEKDKNTRSVIDMSWGEDLLLHCIDIDANF